MIKALGNTVRFCMTSGKVFVQSSMSLAEATNIIDKASTTEIVDKVLPTGTKHIVVDGKYYFPSDGEMPKKEEPVVKKTRRKKNA